MIFPFVITATSIGEALGLLYVVGGHQDRCTAALSARRSVSTARCGSAGSRPTVGSSSRSASARAPGHAPAAAGGACHPKARRGSRRRPRRRARSRARSTAARYVLDAVKACVHRQVIFDCDVDVEVVELGDDTHLGAGGLGVGGQLMAQHPQLARVRQGLARSAAASSSTCRRRWGRAGRGRCPPAPRGRARRPP